MQSRSIPNCSTQTTVPAITGRDFLYVSNLLSMMRIGLTPFLFYSITHQHQFIALGLGGLAVLSDALDGYLARRLNQRSNLGKILDPIADKIAIGSVILALILSNQDFPLWAFGVVVIRDISILLANIVLFRQTRIIGQSDWWGKCTTFLLSTALVLYILGDEAPIHPALRFYVLCVGLVFLLISSWSYSRKLLAMLQHDEPDHKKVT